jgi:hypothetical protein
LITSRSQPPKQYKLTTPILPGIASPDEVETGLGTLHFSDGGSINPTLKCSTVEWSGGATGLDQWLPFVSALSGIVANSPRVMPSFPPPPLFIPYGGFSPVRLEASLVLLRPSETLRGFV